MAMALDFSVGSPMATALHSVIQPKLADCGWTTGAPDDSTLCEYIILMLANQKNEAQIASELSNDLLDLGPDNPETAQFAHWLFEQIDRVKRQLNGGAPAGASDAETSHSNGHQVPSTSNDVSSSAQDTEMEGAAEPAHGAAIPTGPKAMRNGSGSGSGPRTPRDKRMINQLNRQMDRSDDSTLHRVRGSSGTGRINSHSSRDPPKGPRSQQQLGRGIAALANGRGAGLGMGMGGLNGMNPMNGMNGMNMGGMPQMPMPPMGQNGMMPMLDPQQQMQLFQAYEQQAQLMQQILSGQAPQPHINPNFKGNNRNGQSKPLSERIEKPSRHGSKEQLPLSTKFTKKEGQDHAMTDSAPIGENGEASSAMEVELTRAEPSQTMCYFNLKCSKPDCPFVHQGPATSDGVSIDMNDTCSFGAACTNKKCASKHPSPAQRNQHKAETDCAFYPNCRDMANCPFRHPTLPACRNGADCTAPGCKFYHSQVMCKFNPCTNRFCQYKHAEGQKRLYEDKVWTASNSGEEGKEHVSERKFVSDEQGEEELILPGQATSEDTQIIT